MSVSTSVPTVFVSEKTSAEAGAVRWAPKKSIWFGVHLVLALVGCVYFFTFDAFLVFVVFAGLSLCLGHSLGMHRKLIHNAYDCPKWLEYFFVHLGTLVGMAGPIGMMRTHDIRDWAQRQEKCHPYLRHGSSIWRDAWWQLHCELHFEHEPEFRAPAAVASDSVYVWMERTWMWQQLPWAIVLFLLGGIPWVLWGICVRVVVSNVGHWLVGYYAHNSGEKDHVVEGAAVQGHNVSWAGYVSFGECWHNNHHAYPGSALMGLYRGQADPGWYVLNALHNLGLVSNIVLPEDLPDRLELVAVSPRAKASVRERGPESCPVIGALGI